MKTLRNETHLENGKFKDELYARMESNETTMH